MNFREVAFSKIPAFDQFASRLVAFDPTYIPVKAGNEFDVDLYRIYVQRPNSIRIPIDVSEYLLRNLEQNPHGCKSSYTKDLTAKLDERIKISIRGHD